MWTALGGALFHPRRVLPCLCEASTENQPPAGKSPPMKTWDQVFMTAPPYVFSLALCSWNTGTINYGHLSLEGIRVDSASLTFLLHFRSAIHERLTNNRDLLLMVLEAGSPRPGTAWLGPGASPSRGADGQLLVPSPGRKGTRDPLGSLLVSH